MKYHFGSIVSGILYLLYTTLLYVSVVVATTNLGGRYKHLYMHGERAANSTKVAVVVFVSAKKARTMPVRKLQ